MAEHDNSYKLLFSHVELVADLLRGFVHEPWAARLDLATLEKLSDLHVSDDLRDRADDLIWRVRWQDGRKRGQWLYVYLLLEFQSRVDRYMALRVMAYEALLYQDLLRTKRLPRGEPLPPTVAIVLYNGKQRWRAPCELAELMATVPADLRAYQPSLRYILLDQGAMQVSELVSMRNLAAALFRLEHSRTPEDVRQVVDALVVWLDDPDQASLRRAFAEWLRQVVLPVRLPGVIIPEMRELTEVQSMLAERVREWTREWKKEGLQEGLQQGLQQGRIEGETTLLQRQIERKFGPVDEATRARLAGANSEMLLAWGERVLTATCLAAVFDETVPPEDTATL